MDDVSGAPVDPAIVADARKKEMDFRRNLGACTCDAASACKHGARREAVPVIWVDVNEGDDDEP